MDKIKLIKNISNLPETAGVYIFKDKGNFLYIGKAMNIKNRVKNHFQQPTYKDKIFLGRIKKVEVIETDSEIEALILESKLIKKHKPKFNTLWRDDKNYFYAAVTKEGRVFLTHQPKKIYNIDYIGPFVDGAAIKKTLKILRKIFPYYTQKNHPKKLCPWCHLSLCPGPNPNIKEHKKNIRNLKYVLKGKKQSVLKSLKKEMENASKRQDFELAAETRNKIQALKKTLENSKIIMLPPVRENENEEIKKSLEKITGKKNVSRIEAYDISNIQGQLATGSMVVFINSAPAKSLYRKFKIKISGKPNDTAMIKEVLRRRVKHKEWPLPDLFLIDGGKPQLSAAVEVLDKKYYVLALAKKHNELFIKGEKKPVLLKSLPKETSSLILRLRDEAHRFAITYHKKLREVDLDLRN